MTQKTRIEALEKELDDLRRYLDTLHQKEIAIQTTKTRTLSSILSVRRTIHLENKHG